MRHSSILILVSTHERSSVLSALLSDNYEMGGVASRTNGARSNGTRTNGTTASANSFLRPGDVHSPLIIDLRLKGMNALTLLAWVQET
jgi:hypothetical protein